MAYHVTVKASALKSLSKIPRAIRERLLEKITHLADEPRPPGCSKLAGPDHLWLRTRDCPVTRGDAECERLYAADNSHPVEVTGRKLRAMMPWLKAKLPPKA